MQGVAKTIVIAPVTIVISCPPGTRISGTICADVPVTYRTAIAITRVAAVAGGIKCNWAGRCSNTICWILYEDNIVVIRIGAVIIAIGVIISVPAPVIVIRAEQAVTIITSVIIISVGAVHVVIIKH